MNAPTRRKPVVTKTATKSAAKKPAQGKQAAPKKGPAVKSSKASQQGGNVAVIGGGLAGLTSAIKLLRQGFRVTIFERHERLGGNTSSTKVDGVEHDVYPHMFCDWYVNFWDLFEEELGLNRAEHFEPRAGVKMLRQGSSEYQELLNPTSLAAILKNLKSGAMSPAEMFLMGYSMLDLAGYPFNREGYSQLDKLSVNGFLYSQSTSTEQVAALENYVLQVIWSIHSEHTSAVTYQDFLRHTLSFPNGAPFAHMLKNSLQDGLIGPIEGLLKKLGAHVHTSSTVTSVRIEGEKPHIRWSVSGSGTGSGSGSNAAEFDQVIIAVPAGPLTELVLGGDEDLPGDRIIDREESLSQVRRLRSIPIPVIDIYLNRKLDDFPAENIGLTDAQYGLSVVDIAQLWGGEGFGGNSALVIAASDGESLPGHNFDAQAWFMMRELTRYYPEIKIGKYWGDPDSDINWDKTHARANVDYGLFLNDVGSWDWMPDTAYPATMSNVMFAGDLCRGNVDMATVEGAVESGILAAAAVQQADARSRAGMMRGDPITLKLHKTYGDTALRAAKIALMPFAYAAKGWTVVKKNGGGLLKSDIKNLGNSLQSEHIPLLPMQFAVDWWTTAYWFWYSALSPDEGDRPRGASNHDDDRFIGLGAAILMVAGEFASYTSEKCQPSGSATQRDGEAKPAEAVAGLAAMAGQFVQGLMDQQSDSGADPSKPYRRRWRPKR